MKKHILIDLDKLKVLNCGLGQVALNTGMEMGKHDLHDLKLFLYTPSDFVNYFGKNVAYIRSYYTHKVFPQLVRKFDLWHSTNQLSSVLPSSSKTPMLLTIHDLNFLYEKKPEKAQKYLEKVQNRVDRACLITTISEFSANEIRQHIDLRGKEVRVVHNGVRLNDFAESKRPAFIQNNDPFFYTIGQIAEKKNFITLLDVMKLMPNHFLYICGEAKGDYAALINYRIEKEQISNVKLTGSISSEEKNWLYQNCKAFLFPSKFEGFGLPVIEAMQCGKPVFSSEMTSLKEIGDKYAYFWNDFEPKYMANIIKSGLIDFEQNPQRKTDEIKYAHSFSYEKNVNSYLSLYREILGL